MITRRQQRAFTLAEVLVTLLFLAIVLPVSMRGVSLAMAAASNARHTREAASLAEFKLRELTTGLSAAGQSGDFGQDYPEYRWSTQIVSTTYGVSQLDLRVTWDDRGQEHGLLVSTLINPDSNTASSTSGSTQ